MAAEKLGGIDIVTPCIVGFSFAVVDTCRRPWWVAVDHIMYQDLNNPKWVPYKGKIDCMKRVSMEKGFGALFQGLERSIRYSVYWLGPKFIFNSYFNRYFCFLAPKQSKMRENFRYFGVGALASVSQMVVTFPLDTVLQIQRKGKLSFGEALGEVKLRLLARKFCYALPHTAAFGSIYFGLHGILWSELAVCREREGFPPLFTRFIVAYAATAAAVYSTRPFNSIYSELICLHKHDGVGYFGSARIVIQCCKQYGTWYYLYRTRIPLLSQTMRLFLVSELMHIMLGSGRGMYH